MKPLPRRDAYAIPRKVSGFELVLTLIVCFLLVVAAVYVGLPS